MTKLNIRCVEEGLGFSMAEAMIDLESLANEENRLYLKAAKDLYTEAMKELVMAVDAAAAKLYDATKDLESVLADSKVESERIQQIISSLATITAAKTLVSPGLKAPEFLTESINSYFELATENKLLQEKIETMEMPVEKWIEIFRKFRETDVMSEEAEEPTTEA